MEVDSMFLWQTLEFLTPFSGLAIFAFAVSLWFAVRYILFWNTCWHEAEFEKRKAVGE